MIHPPLLILLELFMQLKTVEFDSTLDVDGATTLYNTVMVCGMTST
jgi:hypothetical protein